MEIVCSWCFDPRLSDTDASLFIDFSGLWTFFPFSNLNFFVEEEMFLPQWVWQGHLAGEQALLLNSCGRN